MKKVILSVQNVDKSIGQKQLLHQICLDVFEGEIFGLLGPNGSGKTTLIRSILGLVKIDSGEITLNQYSVHREFEKAISYAGAIVENPEFYPFMTGYQNLSHFAHMHEGISKKRIDDVVSLVHMKNAIHDKVETYSLGMRQRLGIAQAILHKPKLLILDEPTNGLDPSGIRELRTYLRELCEKENVSVIIASHLLKEVEELCTRAAIIRRGQIAAVNEIGRQKDEQLKVWFELSDGKRAMQILQPRYSAVIYNNGLSLLINKNEIPKINQLLVQEKIDVYSIQPVYKSLEDSFIELTEEMFHDEVN
ncbi:ABC transporter ATP-binding protein [Metabacillus idriensis]|uniref:ABC transporter ATP-binding protein n=1 Tax=Metabacillus idriensis TaxID=324768 RepID=UPI003D274290